MRARPISHAVLSLVTIGVFARALPYPLQRSWDDGRFIADNPLVQEVSWSNFVAILARPHFEAYHPLHLLAYWLDVPWFGPDDGLVLHATNLMLWVLAANTLFAAMRALGLGTAGALVAALACVVHPIQVEVVSWATGRKDVLALLFASLCLLWSARSERANDHHAWLARGAFVLAALSKTTTLPLPAVLVLADVWLRGRPLRRALWTQTPSLVLAALGALVVLVIWRAEQMIRPSDPSLAALPLRVVATIGHSLATAILPHSLSPMYSTVAVSEPSVFAFLATGALAAVTVLAARARNRRALFAALTFALLLLPVSNAVPMYFPYQDRYLSLPLLGLGFGLGAFVDAQRRSRPALAAVALLLLALSARTVQYQGEWRSELRLWGHAVSAQPNAYYGFMKLGEVRRDAGELEGAIRAYRRLLELDPRRKAGYAALLQAIALRDERHRRIRPSLAEEYAKAFYEALDDPEALRVLAARMFSTGHMRALELPIERALRIQPFPDQALERAAKAHFEAGRPSLGRFYLRQMRKPTQDPALRALAGQ